MVEELTLEEERKKETRRRNKESSGMGMTEE